MRILPLCISFAVMILTPSMAQAEPISYFTDPVHPSVEKEYQGHPLAHLKNLAEQKNDSRAQFMMGDMLSKGKGGFAQNIDKAYAFFQFSAKGHNPHAFIRLAAIDEKRGHLIGAYQWYYFGSKYFPKGEKRIYMIRQKNRLARENEFTHAQLQDVKRNLKIWDQTDFQYPSLPELHALTLPENVAKVDSETDVVKTPPEPEASESETPQQPTEEQDPSPEIDPKDQDQDKNETASEPAAGNGTEKPVTQEAKTDAPTLTEKKERQENDKDPSQEPNR